MVVETDQLIFNDTTPEYEFLMQTLNKKIELLDIPEKPIVVNLDENLDDSDLDTL